MSLRLRNLQSIEYLTSQTMRRAASHWLNFGCENPDKPTAHNAIVSVIFSYFRGGLLCHFFAHPVLSPKTVSKPIPVGLSALVPYSTYCSSICD